MATKTALKKTPPVMPLATATSVLQSIAAMAADPKVSDERIEKLVCLRAELALEAERKGWLKALNDCQKQMTTISKDAENNQTRSKYATYDQLDKVMRPIYTEKGLTVTFNTIVGEDVPENTIRVRMVLGHVAGHSQGYTVDMPADGKGAHGKQVMTRTHAAGSALTYGRRYLLCMAFNISTGDDDGNAAGNSAPVNRPPPIRNTSFKVLPEHVEEVEVTDAVVERPNDDIEIETITLDQSVMLIDMARMVEANAGKFLAHIGKLWDRPIEGMIDIPAVRFNEAYEMLYQKGIKNGSISD